MAGEQEKLSRGEGDLAAWEVMSRREHARCVVFDVIEKRCRHPKRGTEGDFYVLESRDWVNVLPVTPEGELVLVRQWRFGVEAFSWEIPGGIMDAGESPVEAGLRELVEETGFEARSSRLLGQISPNPAILSNTCFFVLAEGVSLSGAQDWDQHEEIEVKLFPIDEVYAMAARGDIVHSLVVNALFYYYPEWLKLKARRRS